MSLRVVITGGAAGIGATIAASFAATGARLAICDVDPVACAEMAETYRDALVRQADVTDEAAMTRFLGAVETAWGGADVVCANAGTAGPAGPIEALDYADWSACIAANLHGAFLTCRWAARVMKPQGTGLITLTSSTAGQFGYPGRSPYATAKWGVIGLMKTLAMELGPHGIRVNAIAPGAVEGPRMERVLEAEAGASRRDIKQMREAYVKGVSLRTWVTAQEIADMILYLASPSGARISGQTLAIDGHTETLAP